MEEDRRRDWRRMWGDTTMLSKSLGSIPTWTRLMAGEEKQDLADTWVSREYYRTLRNRPSQDDQARFQQRQLIEKEQKLMNMYESSQARVLSRLATQPSQPPAAPPGKVGPKVRQMFEERRTKAGIDKSYPLQPLTTNKPASQRLNGNANQLDRSQEVTLKIKQTKMETTNGLKGQHFELKVVKDINLNEKKLDKKMVLNGSETKSSINKLPNVGRVNVQRQSIKQEANNNIKSPVKNDSDEEPIKSPQNGFVPKAPNRISADRSSKPTVMSPQNTSPKTSSPVASKLAQKISSPAPRSNTTPTKSKANLVRPDSSRKMCDICQRQFAPDRIDKHIEICSKTASKKRRQYDSLKHRVAGTEVETYVRPSRRGARPSVRVAPPAQSPSKPSNWRRQHEDFINTIRAAKQAKLYVSKGGKLSDLPPPPPMDTSHYTQCPHCSRKFSKAAADRHIPKCATMLHNKPKPKPVVKRR